jgi:ATP-binding cassette subfamily B protein
MEKQKKSIKKPLIFVARYAKPYKMSLLIAFLCSIFFVSATIYIPILTGRVLNVIGKSPIDYNLLYLDVLQIAGCAIIGSVFYWFLSYYSSNVSFKMARDMRKKCIDKILNSKLSYIDSSQHGDIVTSIINDVDIISDGLIQMFQQMFTGFFSIIGTIVLMSIICWPLAIIVIGLTPLSMLGAAFIAQGTAKSYKDQSNARGELGNILEENFNNEQIIISYSHEKLSEESYNDVTKKLKKLDFRTSFYGAFINPMTRLINALVYGAVATVGAIYIVQGNYNLTAGYLMTFLMFTDNYTKPFNEISTVIEQLLNSFASANRVMDMLKMPEISDDSKNPPLNNPDGSIDIENVIFSYDKKRTIINGMNIHIKPGMNVALVGTTGCGKTTLINLIMRFYDVDSGHILISGQDVQDITRASLRNAFGMVLQDTWMFKGTIKENIRYAKGDATDDEVIQAAKEAHADFFIMQMKDGYDTIINDDNGLSEGQKQLLCISRLMLVHPKMLILDEATSNIDTRTELLIQEGFGKMMKGHTSLIIAHRLSTIKNADMILVMDKGVIAEKGTHEELLDKNGLYAKLYNSQFAQA